jgi:hypothetical protein
MKKKHSRYTTAKTSYIPKPPAWPFLQSLPSGGDDRAVPPQKGTNWPVVVLYLFL